MRNAPGSVRTAMVAGVLLLTWAGLSVAATLVPGVVVSEDRRTVLSMTPGGGLAAVAASTGEPIWSSGSADRPLAVDAGRVLAQREVLQPGRLELVAVALADGSTLGTSVISLPDSVRARVGDGLGERFAMSAVTAGGGRFATWDYSSRRVQGVAPEPGQGAPESARGAVAVDLATATAAAVDPTEVPVVTPPTPPAGFRQLVAGEALAVAPRPAGELWAAVAVRPGPAGSSTLVLLRWRSDDGQALPAVELWTGRPLHVWTSAGDELALVAARTHPGEWQEYTWSGFDLASGQPVGEVRSEVAMAPVAVLADGLLLTVRPPAARRVAGEMLASPRRLVALDAATGVVAWESPLRDLAFRGPFPP